MSTGRPNILFIVSDEERRNGWMGDRVSLPGHDRLRNDGMSFTKYFTHASPCSPSRASLYTGSYLAEHGVVNNVSFPAHVELDPRIPTVGSLLRDVGYEAGYVGKWHLTHSEFPQLETFGYSGWQGNDQHFTGNAWTGRHFDPIIVDHAVEWLDQHAGRSDPWCLTVALVNPHDIMHFPIDQPSYQAKHEEDRRVFEFIQNLRLGDLDLAPLSEDYPERFDELPANFRDDLSTKPAIQSAWQYVRNNEHFVGSMDLNDERSWLRYLDYYAWLHEQLDVSLSRLLGALDALGIYDETTIVYTSDHGDACGSHGLRAKLPCVYDEVMGVPLIVKAPGTPAGTTTDALGTHVDLATTICATAGVDIGAVPSLSGVDLSPVFADPSATVRDHVLFSQNSAQSDKLAEVRYALRGFYDGETKFARYYGAGGGIRRDGSVGREPMSVPADAPFEDQEHEWYEHREDPHELTNLAADPTRASQVRDLHQRLLTYEHAAFG